MHQKQESMYYLLSFNIILNIKRRKHKKNKKKNARIDAIRTNVNYNKSI